MNIKSTTLTAVEVRAILDGEKTQMRQVVKPIYDKECERYARMGMFAGIKRDASMWYGVDQRGLPFINDLIQQPRYQPGDILWVRETWTTDPHGVDRIAIENGTMPVYYKADYTEAESNELFDGVWRPSIHMPKEAARIWLKVKSVRVERVQEISDDDCYAEGIGETEWFDYAEYMQSAIGRLRGMSTEKAAYTCLWDDINAKHGYGWDSNPWVWVYEFERCDKPE